ncbi:MAG: hypothetical protein ACKOAW_02880, partial [Actinomycetota bacterium]
MTYTRRRGLAAALGTSALAGAALAAGPTASAATDMSSVAASACVERAMEMAQPLVDSIRRPGSAKARGVDRTIERIRQKSKGCEDVLFGDGTAENPNAGLLVGNGYSYDVSTCSED